KPVIQLCALFQQGHRSSYGAHVSNAPRAHRGDRRCTWYPLQLHVALSTTDRRKNLGTYAVGDNKRRRSRVMGMFPLGHITHDIAHAALAVRREQCAAMTPGK